MNFKKTALGALLALAVAATAGWSSLDKETRGVLATLPTNKDVLFWSEKQRDAGFRALDRLPILAKSRVIPAGGTPSPLPPGAPLKLPLQVDAYKAGQLSAALGSWALRGTCAASCRSSVCTSATRRALGRRLACPSTRSVAARREPMSPTWISLSSPGTRWQPGGA